MGFVGAAFADRVDELDATLRSVLALFGANHAIISPDELKLQDSIPLNACASG